MTLKRSKKLMIILAVILVILLVFFGVREFKTITVAMSSLNQMDFLSQLRKQTPTDAILLFFLLAGFSIVPGTPVSVVAILTGIVFGQVIGSLINAVGIIAGNLLAQRIFMYFHEKADVKKTPRIIKTIQKIKYPMIGIILGYMIPFIPTSVISLTVSDVKLSRKFIVIATVIGSLPMAIIYSCGGAALIESHYQLLVWIVAIIAVMLIAVYLVNRNYDDRDVTE